MKTFPSPSRTLRSSTGRFLIVIILLLAQQGSALAAQVTPTPPQPFSQHETVTPLVPPTIPAGQAQHAVTAPLTQQLPKSEATAASATVPNHRRDPVDMRVLVLSADGSESDFAYIKDYLERLGIPYTALVATTSQPPFSSSTLWDGINHGYYQAIILTTGSLVYEASPGYYPSAFTADQWQALWEYEAMFGIRQLSSYTMPETSVDPDSFGLTPNVEGTADQIQGTLTAAGQAVFPYLNPAAAITLANTWTYLSTPISSADTVPLLVTSDGYALAAIHTYANGRQNLAVTTANNPYLRHSLLLSYGLVNWVTRGVFLGERHVYMAPQVDDFFIPDDIWDTKHLTDTTGLSYRMTGQDMLTLQSWQTQTHASYPLVNALALSLVYNGEGTDSSVYPDAGSPTLVATVPQTKDSFNWINHTYSHLNLDASSYNESLSELTTNHNIATSLGLTRYNRDSLVQPDVSGLYNSNFLRAAYDFGIRNLVSDASRTGWNNPSPNAGYYSTYQPSILIIPRHASNLFYNVSNPTEWVSEYNWFYAPGGKAAYYDHNLTYSEILNYESDFWLQYLLRWDIDPVMFHQANLRAYSGGNSLIGDLISATLAKYSQAYNLPIVSPTMHDLGATMGRRMAYNNSGVGATIAACRSITVTTSNAALIPVTGVTYGSNTEQYGGQSISYVELAKGGQAVLAAPSCPAPVAVAGAHQIALVGSTVKLDGSASYDTHDGLTVTYGWQQAGGTPVVLSSPTASQPTFIAPSQPAVITFTLTVTDSYGQRSAPSLTQVSVKDIAPTSLAVASSSPTHLGSNTAFTATSDGSNLTYAWDFGDGTTGSGNPATHSYAAPGRYTTQLTVANTAGHLSTSAQVDVDKFLAAGWNLVSFDVTPSDPSLSGVLGTIAGSYNLVYAWDAANQTWLKYDANAPSYVNDLQQLGPGMGFWINITTSAGVPWSVAGSAPAQTSIALSPGWNLVGYPASIARQLPDALSANGVGDHFSLVFTYQAGGWQLYDRTSTIVEWPLKELAPGWGYWVLMDEASTWTVNHAAP